GHPVHYRWYCHRGGCVLPDKEMVVQTMGEVKDWMWLLTTAKGDFLISVAGEWTQEEAAQKLKYVLKYS
ncbi:hypothetical protein LCGC14_1357290, partial [marine sediment metagenome]